MQVEIRHAVFRHEASIATSTHTVIQRQSVRRSDIRMHRHESRVRQFLLSSL